jgi:O-6-methylguanine DNA methyltransferase
MKRKLAYALFDTALGRCAIAWSLRGIVRLQFPDASDTTAVRRLARGDELVSTEPPPIIARAIDEIRRHLGGDPQTFRDLPLDWSGVADFHRRVYRAACAIPAGRTASYGELASRIGAPGAARAVGQALGKNPLPIVVPCHRVLAANGKMGGFSAYGGVATKRRILAVEGLVLDRDVAARKPPAQVSLSFSDDRLPRSAGRSVRIG